MPHSLLAAVPMDTTPTPVDVNTPVQAAFTSGTSLLTTVLVPGFAGIAIVSIGIKVGTSWVRSALNK